VVHRGRWLPVLCALIDFTYLVTFLSAVSVGLAMLEQLFPVSQSHPWSALFVGAFTAFHLLMVLSHPACGLLAHGASMPRQ
jgi:hypothetical protein